MSARHAPGLRVVAGVVVAAVGAVSVAVEAEAVVAAVASVAAGEDAGRSNPPLFSKRETSGGWLYKAANLRCFYLCKNTRLTEYLHAVESLCQFETLPLSHSLMLLPQHFL